MAPKKASAGAKPPAHEAIKLLEQSSEGISATGIKAMEPAARKRLLTAFKLYAQNDDERLQSYGAATDNVARQTILAKYVMDTKQGRLGLNNTETAFNNKKDSEKGEWLTDMQIAAPCNENDEAAPKLWIEDCAPELVRDHERPAYANKWIKQYWYCKVKKVTEGGHNSSANLTHDVDFQDDTHYKEVLASMQQCIDQEVPLQ